MGGYKIGDRVGAISSSDKEKNTVFMFGYGRYAGDVVVPDGWLKGVPNPKIELDDGGEVWGYMCWWGGEAKIQKMVEGAKIVIVQPPKHPE